MYQIYDVILVELDPVRGHEQGGTRPCLVISEAFTQFEGTLVVLPITKVFRPLASMIHLSQWKEYGLSIPSYIIGHQPTTIDISQIQSVFGNISDVETQATIQKILKRILHL